MSEARSVPTGAKSKARPVVFAVDDEPMLLELASMILEPLGYQVLTFRDPVSALRAYSLADPLPVLIITDFAMHEMHGLDLIRDCRRIHPDQMILMVSGTVDATVYRDSPHKPDGFLAKPYSSDELTTHVNKLLSH